MSRRWLFADQLGPHFLDEPDQPVLLVESRAAFGRRPLHRRKAHLVLSALRHRAAELGDQALLVRARTYREAVDRVRAETRDQLTVCAPTSWAARRLTGDVPGVTALPARGFGTGEEEFAAWAARRGRRRLLMEDFYRDARRRLDILMDGAEPAGGRWNFDADNREPAGDGMNLPARPAVDEDDIDHQVRRDLNEWEHGGEIRLTGRDGPREFPVTRAEALAALRAFVRDRLPYFGPQQDAMLAGDPNMAHSLLSPALNLGLLDPVECARAAEDAYRAGSAPLASTEGFIRQLIGWFHANFADGYDWVMVPNVVGMSQHADGGVMASKPYVSGGAYINRMSDYCGDCAYRPGDRLGPRACPFTSGYWVFLDRHADRFAHNPRMARQVKGLNRLTDLAEVRRQQRSRGDDPP